MSPSPNSCPGSCTESRVHSPLTAFTFTHTTHTYSTHGEPACNFLFPDFPHVIPSPTLTHPRAPSPRAPQPVLSLNHLVPKSGTCPFEKAAPHPPRRLLLFPSDMTISQPTRWHVTSFFQAQLVARRRGGRVIQHDAETVYGRLTGAQSVRVLHPTPSSFHG